MRRKETILHAAALWVLVVIVSASCSSGPQRSSSNRWTPRWQETELLLSDGRIDETLQQVEILLAAEEPHRTKAAAWKILVLAGKARGYFELAEAYVAGAEENPARFSDFRRAVSKYRSHSRGASLALAQMATDSERYFGRADTIPLDFPLPPGSTSPSPIVASIKVGRLAPEPQLLAAEQYTLRRVIVLTVLEASRTMSETKNPEEGLDMQPVAIPKPRLLAVMGKVLYQQADLFTKTHLDDPEKYGLLLDLSEHLLETSLLYQQQQKAGLELWQTELQNRRSLP
jgi:hypothetical protein